MNGSATVSPRSVIITSTCYPVALRAISATVPTAFFVFFVGRSCRNQTHKTTKTVKQNIQIAQKSCKIDARRGPGGSWGRFRDHFGSRGCPRGVPGTPGAEKVTKSSLDPRLFPKLWGTKHFRHVCDFSGSFFGGRRSESCRPHFRVHLDS